MSVCVFACGCEPGSPVAGPEPGSYLIKSSIVCLPLSVFPPRSVCLCLSICLSASVCVCLPLSICLRVCLCFCLRVSLFVCLGVSQAPLNTGAEPGSYHLYVSAQCVLPLCWSVCPCVCRLSLCLRVCLLVCLGVSQSPLNTGAEPGS